MLKGGWRARCAAHRFSASPAASGTGRSRDGDDDSTMAADGGPEAGGAAGGTAARLDLDRPHRWGGLGEAPQYASQKIWPKHAPLWTTFLSSCFSWRCTPRDPGGGGTARQDLCRAQQVPLGGGVGHPGECSLAWGGAALGNGAGLARPRLPGGRAASGWLARCWTGVTGA